MDIDTILKSCQRFGVHLGLERIEKLLATLGNPHHSVPIIHVAGTNGKGSVCAYLSAILTEAGYQVGRYISPHLVDWNERICLNEQPISQKTLGELLLKVQAAIPEGEDSPTQFEVITAAAWLYFAQQQVDVAVVEVGLGGRLDATNVCAHPLVTIITSLSREHWQTLGPTLADIAREKAGILKPGCPAVVGQLPAEARAVVEQRITELDCPAVWPEPAQRLTPPDQRGDLTEVLNSALSLPDQDRDATEVLSSNLSPTYQGVVLGGWAEYQDPRSLGLNPKSIKYPLPLLGDIQLSNSALAIAALQILREQGWEISEPALTAGMAKTKWPGRLQWTTWQNHPLLIDGAHNPAAAQALCQYVDTLHKSPISWVMGMLSTKDHADIFKALLQPSDRLYLVPVPDHSSADPHNLATLARDLCPELAHCQSYLDLKTGLAAATSSSENLVVLCGSLYLVGHFLKYKHD